MAIIAAIMVASGVYFLHPGRHESTLFHELPNQPPSIQTNIPELTAQVEKVQHETDQAVAKYQPKRPDRIDDLTIPAKDILQQLPGVEKVEVLVAVQKPTARIVHLANWHFFPKDLFDIDIEQAPLLVPNSGDRGRGRGGLYASNTFKKGFNNKLGLRAERSPSHLEPYKIP
jgi:hypothetical protein